MAEVRVKMLQTHASADFVLQSGKTYLVPEEVAIALTAKGSGGPEGQPAAEVVRGVKAQRPTKPDPGEKTSDEEDSGTDGDE